LSGSSLLIILYLVSFNLVSFIGYPLLVIFYMDMQAYVDLVVCIYARVLQKLHEERIASPGPEVDSKYFKAMDACMAFRARTDIAPYIAPGAPCDRLHPHTLSACQSDKTDGVPLTLTPTSPISLTSPTQRYVAAHKLEPTTHHLTQAPYTTTRVAVAASPAGVAEFPFDPGVRAKHITGEACSSFPFDPGG
jgi:hypothetical protein